MVVVWASIAFLILLAGHWFLYRRLVKSLSVVTGRMRWWLRVLTAGLLVLIPAGWMGSEILPEGPAFILHFASAVWLGVLWHLFWMSAVLYLLQLLMRVTGLEERLASRERAIGKTGVLGVIVLSVVLSAMGIRSVQDEAKVVEVSVPVKHLSPELKEMRIAAAADFHAGALVGPEAVGRMVRRIQELKPDLILLAGDLLERGTSHREALVAEFRKLQAPYGVLGCTGNHEFYAGIDSSLAFCRRAGIFILTNKLVKLPGGLVVAGYDDRAAEFFGRTRPPLDSLLLPAAKLSPTILLMHTPVTRDVERAIEAGVDLVISGHTHGGQVWPFSVLTKLAFRYHRGLYQVGRGHALTTCGIGYWGTPMRLGASAEIVLIRLMEGNF